MVQVTALQSLIKTGVSLHVTKAAQLSMPDIETLVRQAMLTGTRMQVDFDVLPLDDLLYLSRLAGFLLTVHI